MRRCRRAILWLSAAGLTASVAGNWSTVQAESTSLLELAYPDLGQLEETVKQQLTEARRRFDEALSQSGVSPRELGEEYGQMGRLYYVYDFVDLAEVCFLNAQTLRPDDSRWPHLLGAVHRLEGELEKAIASFERALELAPEAAASWSRLGEALIAVSRPEEAETAYRRVLELEPESAAARYGLGRISYLRGDYEQAIESFLRALELQPEATSIHHLLGMAYRQQGSLDRARSHLARNTGGRVRVEDPLIDELGSLVQSTRLPFKAGVDAMRRGDYQTAVKWFLLAREQNPEDYLVPYNLALAMLRLDSRDDALEWLRTSIAVNPDFRNGHYNLAVMLAEEGKLDEATFHLGEAHRIDPEDQQAHLEWATALGELGRVGQATAELEKLLALGGDARIRAQAQFHLGVLAERTGMGLKAVEHYRAAVELAPDLRDARMALASQLGRSGDYAGAAAQFSVVVAEDPSRLEAHFGRAMALILGASYASARAALEESLEVQAGNPVLKHALARLLATCPDAEIRDGEKALLLAREVWSREQTIEHAETLAMALAESQRFAEAIDIQQRIVSEAERLDQSALADRARRRLDLYRQGKPVRAPWHDG